MDLNPEGRSEWIVAESVRDFVSWDGMTNDPVVHIPEEWPAVGPAVPEIRSLISDGFGLYVQGVFDLEQLGETAAELAVLHCAAGPDVRGADALPRMTSLRYLYNDPYKAAAMPTVDLSQLAELEQVNIHGRGLLSALNAPNLRDACVEIPSLTSSTPLSPSLRSLVVVSPEVDFEHLAGSLPNLARLSLLDCRQIDLSPIRRLRGLEELHLVNVRCIDHAEALTTLPALKRLRIDGTSRMTGLARLLELTVDSFSAYGTAFDSNFAAAAKRKNWHVTPAPNAAHSHFDLIKSDSGPVEIHFTDWVWLAEALGGDEHELPTSFELETALERVIAEQPEHFPRTHSFDSEGDAFIAQTSDEANALELLKIWDRVLSDPAELRRRLRRRDDISSV
ncbi:hypothetical protein ACFZA2_08465 [Microbacterium sp. NPDC007973]|uniref:hypothetical protein n=1 Tax=Microbacterium sp. NPDC007973 TaxID=3364182 RepID=UPI0036E440E6